MSEYKRLTERDEYGNADIIGLSTEKLFGELYFDEINLLTKALNKLALLETKIESGTLIELPCKVGDTVYFIEYFCNANGCSNDKQTICCGCSEMLERERKKQTYVISEKKFRLGDSSKINKTLYITKEAAEARLKELQEEQK